MEGRFTQPDRVAQDPTRRVRGSRLASPILPESPEPGVRINRYLADCGLGSRRSCEALVRAGRVSINGDRCIELSTRVRSGDHVLVDGEPVEQGEQHITLLLNKPPGPLCTRDDPGGRDTIFDLLPAHLRRQRNLSYAGRLDRDSEGLLVLSTDGSIIQRLTHPSNKIEKEYLVWLTKPFHEEDAGKMLAGIDTPDGLARAKSVEKVSKRTVAVVLEQGMKRQIRVMLDALGYGVKRLARVRIGGLEAPGLQPGQWRFLGRRDLCQLLGETKH